jgi:ubiquinone/menaquinone biosynthesis C-methylase UbiE
MQQSRFTDADTQALFDDRDRDQRFRNFWHPDGSLHWGYFEDFAAAKPEDFQAACDRWDQYMLDQSGITAESRVLEVACGNGNASIWIAQQTGCEVIGLDLTPSYIENATEKAKNYPNSRVSFQQGSATELPFAEGSFTHVWSQAALYHIHDLTAALKEAYRVLEPQGIFLFDDLVTPKAEISEGTMKSVYDRLRFKPTFSPAAYAETLTNIGFKVSQLNLTDHLHKSYELVAALAEQANHPEMSAAFNNTRGAIEAQELGWCFHLCTKG